MAKLRKVGGSVMLAIPPAFLEQLALTPQASVGVAVEDGRLIVQPAAPRPKYRLADLLAQCDPDVPLTDEDRAWLGDPPKGRELI